MNILIFESTQELAQAAAGDAAGVICAAIRERGRARVVAATGNSQMQFLDALVRAPGIEWSKTTFFQLDEYIGLPPGHPGSLGEYLRRRLVDRVHPGEMHFLDGTNTAAVAQLVAEQPIDIAFVGIGENGHLAFNDPPADFETGEPYIVVHLDEPCRRQQSGEGWFATPEDVPPTAISMSIRQIMKSGRILCVVPERRKARAVADCLGREIGPWCPSSILRTHPCATVYLDRESSSLMNSAQCAGIPKL